MMVKLRPMERVVEILTWLKTKDLTALTAFQTLCRDMGWKDVVHNLQRRELWRTRVKVEDEKELERVSRDLVQRVKIFVNPNKHKWEIRFPEERKKVLMEGEGEGLYRVEVWVWWREDPREVSAYRTLIDTWGYKDKILEVKRRDIWEIVLEGDDVQKVRGKVEEIVVTRSREKGILINPHSQDFSITRILKV